MSGCPRGGQRPHAVEDRALGDGVERGRGVVEHEDRGAGDEGAGQGQPLPLATGEGHAPIAETGVQPLGEPGDDLVGRGHG